tara:strand:- start:2461 stop:3015 length:555 start_codon:yes stop_codon:yes gene_type:complete
LTILIYIKNKTMNDLRIEAIKKVIYDLLKVDLDDPFTNISRKTVYLDARMIYFFLAKEFTSYGLDKLGKTIEPRKDHTSVLHNIKRCRDLKEFDKEFSIKFNWVKDKYRAKDADIIEDSLTLEEALIKIKHLEKLNEEIVSNREDLIETVINLKDSLRNHKKYLEEQGYDCSTGGRVFKILGLK